MSARLSDRTRVETLVVLLGVLGLLPFVLLLLWPDISQGGFYFKGYALAILAFLAGNWWSVALMARGPGSRDRIIVLLVSNVMVLAGVALLLSKNSLAFPGLAAIFVTQVIGEKRLRVFHRQPAYYRRMRNFVTAGVVLLHLLAWWRFSI